MKKSLFIILIFGFLSCVTTTEKQQQKATIDLDAELAAIEQLRSTFQEAVKNSDGATIGALVTKDAKTIAPGCAAWLDMKKLNAGKPFPYDSIKMNPVETVLVSDSIAYDMGISDVYYTDSLGNQVLLRDTFLALLKKGEDGQWRLFREVASSSVPN